MCVCAAGMVAVGGGPSRPFSLRSESSSESVNATSKAHCFFAPDTARWPGKLCEAKAFKSIGSHQWLSLPLVACCRLVPRQEGTNTLSDLRRGSRTGSRDGLGGAPGQFLRLGAGRTLLGANVTPFLP